MKLNEMSDSAFLKWAKAEDCAPVTSGSLRGAFEKSETEAPEHSVPVMKFAFGSLITLQRRKNAWTIEELARRAEIDLDEAVSIEEDPSFRPEPRAVYQLAKVLSLPTKKLLVLSGNAEQVSPRLEQAAVKFAARSRAVEKLTEAEMNALSEFVSELVEDDERKVL